MDLVNKLNGLTISNNFWNKFWSFINDPNDTKTIEFIELSPEQQLKLHRMCKEHSIRFKFLKDGIIQLKKIKPYEFMPISTKRKDNMVTNFISSLNCRKCGDNGGYCLLMVSSKYPDFYCKECLQKDNKNLLEWQPLQCLY